RRQGAILWHESRNRRRAYVIGRVVHLLAIQDGEDKDLLHDVADVDRGGGCTARCPKTSIPSPDTVEAANEALPAACLSKLTPQPTPNCLYATKTRLVELRLFFTRNRAEVICLRMAN